LKSRQRGTDHHLWLYLVREWIPKNMGTTGPTLPFLIGATRVVGIKSGIADISELSALLYTFQRVTSHYIRIQICGTLRQPVAAAYDRNEIMDVEELIKIRKGESALYVSQTYPHQREIESVSNALWAKVESAITSEQYSFNNRRYGAYTEKDLTFISRAAYQAG
jgi:hypothetical protein